MQTMFQVLAEDSQHIAAGLQEAVQFRVSSCHDLRELGTICLLQVGPVLRMFAEVNSAVFAPSRVRSFSYINFYILEASIKVKQKALAQNRGWKPANSLFCKQPAIAPHNSCKFNRRDLTSCRITN